MNLLPLPRSIVEKNGCFMLGYATRIVADDRLSADTVAVCEYLNAHIQSITGIRLYALRGPAECGGKDSILFRKSARPMGREEYSLSVSSDRIVVEASEYAGAFYGAVTLCQVLTERSTRLPCMDIHDRPSYANRAYMLDVSRGRMPTYAALTQIVDRLCYYKINQLQLYVEHAFRYSGQSEAWIKTDALTADDILRLDRYCKSRCIELVPCMATFGHLYDTLDTRSFGNLSEMGREAGEPFTWFHRMRYHILNASDPASLDFVKKMLDDVLPLFSSDKINICCDETFDLGKNKSRDLAEKLGRGTLYMRYVNEIVSYLEERGKRVMIWADIALRHPEALPLLPKTVTCLNWHYYYNADESKIEALSDRGLPQYVCPSVSGFSRLVHAMDMSFSNIRELALLGEKHHAEGFMNTDWGDSGHVNMFAGAVPGMIYGACMSWNTLDGRSFEEIDGAVSLIEYGDGTQKLVPMLRELSRQDIVIFNTIAFFRDFKIYGLPYRVFGTCLYENGKKEMEDASASALAAASAKSMEIAGDLLCHSARVKPGRHRDMREFYLSARGVALMQSLALVLKRFEYGQEAVLLHSPWELAEQLEYWLADYCEVWRESCREGELSRIREFVGHICGILRDYPK